MVSRWLASLLLATSLAQWAAARETAPDFSGVAINTGEPIRLADFRGKVVFLDFWASWCPPCLASLPAYERMRRAIGTASFEIIAINVDEDTDDGLAFLERRPVSYPVLADPQGVIGKPYGLRTLPHAFLLDRQGRIVRAWRNFRAGDEVAIRRAIERQIAEPP